MVEYSWGSLRVRVNLSELLLNSLMTLYGVAMRYLYKLTFLTTAMGQNFPFLDIEPYVRNRPSLCENSKSSILSVIFSLKPCLIEYYNY